jgi:glycosyltransferase involved in cell wall biosynthesis
MDQAATSEPFVSVITPFYNTDAYLAECIESVLDQKYRNFEYILVDNQSTDRSREIVERYVKKDSRMRLVRTDRFLTQSQNYNFTFRQISPESRYCKMVQADDWIFPNCLTEMVALAEAHPSIGLVSSYRLEGTMVHGGGLEVTQRFLPGREAARLHFLKIPIFLFGSPTTVMYRSDIVRQSSPFFDEGQLHADTDVCYEILRHHDFGFVHQVLSYSRLDPESITGKAMQMCPRELDLVIILKRHGAAFLDPDEYRRCLDSANQWYYEAVARKWVQTKLTRSTGGAFWDYQAKGLATVGETVRPGRLALGFLGAATAAILPPLKRKY